MISGSQYTAAESLRERYQRNRARRCKHPGCGLKVAYDREQSFCGAHYPKGAEDRRTPGRPRGSGTGRKLPALKPVMERRGLSLDDVAWVSGVPRRDVYDLFRLHRGARPEEWEAIAQALGVSTMHLATRPHKGGTDFSRKGGTGRPPGLELAGLWAVMKAKDVTCDGLGEQVGVSGAHVSDLRRGKRGASEETAAKLARALGVTVEELEGEK